MNFIKQFFNAISDKHKEILKDKRMSDGLKKSLEYEKLSSNPKFHRTEKEEDLSFNFSQKYASIIEKHEKEIYEKVGVATRSLSFGDFDIDDMIKLHEEAIRVFYIFRDFCFSKSEGGKIYFEDMWLCCHNSKQHRFSYIDEVEQQLKHLKSNYDEKRLYYEKLRKVKEEIKNILCVQQEIEQKELFKRFAPMKALDIRIIIKSLRDEGSIVVEKISGNNIVKKSS